MAHPVDTHVGQRIRQRRWTIDMTQQQLGDKVGIKFQQIQKYETGANRVSASRLWDISEALGVDIAYFFEGLNNEGQSETPLPASETESKEAAQLVGSFFSLPEHQRSNLRNLMDAMRAA